MVLKGLTIGVNTKDTCKRSRGEVGGWGLARGVGDSSEWVVEGTLTQASPDKGKE